MPRFDFILIGLRGDVVFSLALAELFERPRNLMGIDLHQFSSFFERHPLRVAASLVCDQNLHRIPLPYQLKIGAQGEIRDNYPRVFSVLYWADQREGWMSMDTGNWEREPFCLDGNARRNLPQEAGSGIISTEFVPGDLLPGEFMRRRNNEGRIMRFMAPDPDKPDHVICAWAERGPDRQIVQRSFPISELGRYRFAGVIRIRT